MLCDRDVNLDWNQDFCDKENLNCPLTDLTLLVRATIAVYEDQHFQSPKINDSLNTMCQNLAT